MSNTNPRIIFGVHQITAYERGSYIPYGTAKILGQSNFSLSGEIVSLQGGSSRYDWANEDGAITAELSVTFKQYENWMMNLFLGANTVQNGAGVGSIQNFKNIKGTSVFKADTGITTLSVNTSQDLKFGTYVIEALTANTVAVYPMSDVDFARGDDGAYLDDDLKILDNATITMNAATLITKFGIDMNGGTAATAFTVGDTAAFEVVPPSSEDMYANIGGSFDTFPEFGAFCTAQQRGTQEMVDIQIYKLKALGMPINMTEKAYSEAEITARAAYDSAENKVFRIRHINPA